MFNFYLNQTPLIDWTTILISLLSAVIGALIAGYFSSKATEKAHQNNRELAQIQRDDYEKATALSIIEEMKALSSVYEKEFDEQYRALDEESFVDRFYISTLDYTTVYTQNAGELGLIQNKRLREFLINFNILFKKYIEELKIYKMLLEEFYNSRNKFVATVFKEYVNEECSQIDTNGEIESILKYIEENNWSWLNQEYMTKEQVESFIKSDTATKTYLCEFSQRLKNDYEELKEVGYNAIDLAEKEYSEE